MAQVTIYGSMTLSVITTNDRRQIKSIRDNARERTMQIDFDSVKKGFNHLIYYVELKDGTIHVYENPMAYTDDDLEEMLNRCNPVFVGARHRR